MQPLIDMDILLHEIGWASQKVEDLPTGEKGEVIQPFNTVAAWFDEKIQEICLAVGTLGYRADPPILFYTVGHNFRYDIAKSKPYKGTRKDLKPFHFKNLIAYATANYEVRAIEGLEADDAICIEQMTRTHTHPSKTDPFYLTEPNATIICSRDKDLKQCLGWHYGWECGLQPSFGPRFVTYLGELSLQETPLKLNGTGISYFYAQLLMGDSVDNIPGCPGIGPRKAYNLLSGLDSKLEMFKAVKQAYKDAGKDEEYLLEQGRLLWMIREVDLGPVMWDFPTE
jgi:hypothetical protein